MLQRLNFRAMGCEMLAVLEQDSDAAPSILSDVPIWFEEWEHVLSRFRMDSELTRLNQETGRPVHVSQTLWDVFQSALAAERMTGGLVTPMVLDAMIAAGYDKSFELLSPPAGYMPAPVSTATRPLTTVTHDPAARTITVSAGLGLDFGGTAKGWAAQEVVKRLHVVGPVLMDAAGDIAVSGARADGGPWVIAVADPMHPGRELAMLHLYNGGVATSGKDRRRWFHKGEWRHHIVDPFTSQPAETDLLTVTVIAPNVMEAEAAAKAAFILGSRAGLEWIEARPPLAGLFIMEDGQILYSQRIESYL